jgi:curved DNA-binding protein
MPGKDYYKILGIPKTASAEEIKKAYRRLAMKHHPDHNKGDKTSEAKFKDISEAYAVLSNGEKRKQYDRFGAEGFERRYTQEDIFRDFDVGSIFRDFGFGGGRGRNANIFTQTFGGMGQDRHRDRGSPFESPFRGHGGAQPARGRDLVYELSMTLEEAATTTQKTVTYQTEGRQQTVSVKVPAGISTGKKLRLPGKGQEGLHGGPPGDLYVQVRVLDHPVFRREGDDLVLERAIRFSEVLSGTEIDVPTVHQKTLRLKIPQGTQCNAKLRMKGYGMPRMDGSGHGDALVQISIAVPEKLNRKQKALLKDMEEAGL